MIKRKNHTSNYTTEINQAMQVLKEPGTVTEVRILNTQKGTVSGYYNDYEKLAKDISPYNGKDNIYFTINPVKDELLARSNNRLTVYAKNTTSDADVVKREILMIDLDAKRPSGISSTDEEHQRAIDKAREIQSFLTEKFKWPEPALADSGNGAHLLYLIDLANDKESTDLLRKLLKVLDVFFTDENVEVDKTTYNASRITKFYGTKACKGDDTKERPHRMSKILEAPEERNLVSKDQLQTVANLMPVEEISSKGEGKLNIEDWMAKYDLEVYKEKTMNYGVVYELKVCPWNSDHTDASAFIIQFKSGAISAGCHHNSCSEENWFSLKKLLGDNTGAESSKKSKYDGEKKNQADKLIELSMGCKFFKDELEDGFAAANIDGHWEVMGLDTSKFKLYLTGLYYKDTDEAPSPDAINQALNVLKMKAVFSDDEFVLSKRIAKVDDTYYYDLCDDEWRVIKINAEGCKIDETPPILFTRNNNMKEQQEPDRTVEPKDLVDLVNKHFRLKENADKVLFTTYLVSCFLPQIAHVILVIYGEKGAAKSTTMTMVKELVDPAQISLLTMPSSIQDLAIILSNNYMPCFDNMESLSDSQSSMLCIAATGGAFSTRTLYKNNDETILKLKRCVALNGINVVAQKPDLLDRAILIELPRIPKGERKTEKKIWEEFDKDKPKFLGAIFNTISEAISLYGMQELTEVGRMADFTLWGYSISEVLGLGGESFIDAYLGNQTRVNEEALSSNPLAEALIAFMRDKKSWTGSVSELLGKLGVVATNNSINTRIKSWPANASVLSRRLKEIKSNLEDVGIQYDIRNAGQYKKITLENDRVEVLYKKAKASEKNSKSELEEILHSDSNMTIFELKDEDMDF